MTTVILALGANIIGTWGVPTQTLARAVRELHREGVTTVRASALYQTAPWGKARQPKFLNAVLQVRTARSAQELLRIAKQIERRAGRRHAVRNAPRPLDIDIIDVKGRIRGWPVRRRMPGRLILPHPETHQRRFVLVPLADIAPHWRHPVLGLEIRQLLDRLPDEPGALRRVLDSRWVLCDR